MKIRNQLYLLILCAITVSCSSLGQTPDDEYKRASVHNDQIRHNVHNCHTEPHKANKFKNYHSTMEYNSHKHRLPNGIHYKNSYCQLFHMNNHLYHQDGDIYNCHSFHCNKINKVDEKQENQSLNNKKSIENIEKKNKKHEFIEIEKNHECSFDCEYCNRCNCNDKDCNHFPKSVTNNIPISSENTDTVLTSSKHSCKKCIDEKNQDISMDTIQSSSQTFSDANSKKSDLNIDFKVSYDNSNIIPLENQQSSIKEKFYTKAYKKQNNINRSLNSIQNKQYNTNKVVTKANSIQSEYEYTSQLSSSTSKNSTNSSNHKLGLETPRTPAPIPYNYTLHSSTIVDNYYYLFSQVETTKYYIQNESSYTNEILKMLPYKRFYSGILKNLLSLTSKSEIFTMSYVGKNIYKHKMANKTLETPIDFQNSDSKNFIEVNFESNRLYYNDTLIFDFNNIFDPLNRKYFKIGKICINHYDPNLILFTVDLEGEEKYVLYYFNFNDSSLQEMDSNVSDSVIWISDHSFVYTTITKLELQPLVAYHMDIIRLKPILLFSCNNYGYSLHMTLSADGTILFFHLSGYSTRYQNYITVQKLLEWEPKANQDSILKSNINMKIDPPPITLDNVIPEKFQQKYWADYANGYFFVMINGDCSDFRLVAFKEIEKQDISQWIEVIPCAVNGPYISKIEVTKNYLIVWVISSNVEQNFRIFKYAEVDSNIKFEEISFPFISKIDKVYSLKPLIEMYTVGTSHPSLPDAYLNNNLYFSYSSFHQPPIYYKIDIEKEIISNSTLINYDKFVKDQYKVGKLFARNEDSSDVPITYAYSTSFVKQFSENEEILSSVAYPVIVEVYGAFGENSFPNFEPEKIPILDMGIIYMRCHVRGSSIKGQSWYQSGKLLHKENTFLDLIACIEFIHRSGISQKEKTGIIGDGLGGLAVLSTALLKRPDLFTAVLARNPFVDIVNSLADTAIPQTIKRYSELGSVFIAMYFENIYSYDPYLRMQGNIEYPDLFLVTEVENHRSNYWEHAKFIAKMRSINAFVIDNPEKVLLQSRKGNQFSGFTVDENILYLSQQYGWMISRINPVFNFNSKVLIFIIISTVATFTVLIPLICFLRFAFSQFYVRKVTRLHSDYETLAENQL